LGKYCPYRPRSTDLSGGDGPWLSEC